PETVTERERHVIGPHDFADLTEVRVGEILLMMREAPLRHDRTAARNDAGDATGGQRYVAKQYPGVDREVIHPLLALLDQRVAITLPGQFFGPAANFFERLIDRHGPDRDGRIANDPLPRLVNVLPGREIHDRVGAPQGGPAQLVHLFLD